MGLICDLFVLVIRDFCYVCVSVGFFCVFFFFFLCGRIVWRCFAAVLGGLCFR